jgi:hypothetical protein
LLGSLQPAGLMVLDRNRQCFGKRCHKAHYDKQGDKEASAPPPVFCFFFHLATPSPSHRVIFRPPCVPPLNAIE